MLRNIAGPHIQSLAEQSARNLLDRPAGSLKILQGAFDLGRIMAFHQRNPNAPICFRYVDDSVNLDNGVAKQNDAIRYYEQAVGRIRGDVLWLESIINEKFMFGDELSRLAEVNVKQCDLVTNAGFRFVGFNIPVGNIAYIDGAVIDGTVVNKDTSDINRIRQAVAYLNDRGGAVGYHNYTVPDRQLSNWLDLRHERMALELPPDTLWWLGEGLYDYGIIDGSRLRGWRFEDFHQTPESVSRYTRSIAQYLAQDERVVAWTPFGAGPEQPWIDWGFRYDDENLICQIFQERYEVSDPSGNPGGGDGNMIVIGDGFRRMIPYLGSPLESEVYHFAGTPMEMSAAVFENGVAQWFKASNETVGQRSDGAIFTDRGNNGDGHTVWQVWAP